MVLPVSFLSFKKIIIIKGKKRTEKKKGKEEKLFLVNQEEGKGHESQTYVAIGRERRPHTITMRHINALVTQGLVLAWIVDTWDSCVN